VVVNVPSGSEPRTKARELAQYLRSTRDLNTNRALGIELRFDASYTRENIETYLSTLSQSIIEQGLPSDTPILVDVSDRNLTDEQIENIEQTGEPFGVTNIKPVIRKTVEELLQKPFTSRWAAAVTINPNDMTPGTYSRVLANMSAPVRIIEAEEMTAQGQGGVGLTWFDLVSLFTRPLTPPEQSARAAQNVLATLGRLAQQNADPRSGEPDRSYLNAFAWNLLPLLDDKDLNLVPAALRPSLTNDENLVLSGAIDNVKRLIEKANPEDRLAVVYVFIQELYAGALARLNDVDSKELRRSGDTQHFAALATRFARTSTDQKQNLYATIVKMRLRILPILPENRELMKEYETERQKVLDRQDQRLSRVQRLYHDYESAQLKLAGVALTEMRVEIKNQIVAIMNEKDTPVDVMALVLDLYARVLEADSSKGEMNDAAGAAAGTVIETTRALLSAA
jgi:hypothetical protein